MLPTTSKLIGSHPVRGGNAEQAERIGQDDPGGAGQQQPGLLGGGTLGGPDGAGVVIPPVHDGGQLVQVDRDAVRLPLACRLLDDLGEEPSFLSSSVSCGAGSAARSRSPLTVSGSRSAVRKIPLSRACAIWT